MKHPSIAVLFCFIIALAATLPGAAIITTFASGLANGDGGQAGLAPAAPHYVLADAKGNLYFSEPSNHRVRKVDSTGLISTLAGTGAPGFSGDGGPAGAARLYQPMGLALDSAGSLYVADSGNNRVRKIDSSGIITTVAGTGTPAFSGDGGPASLAALNQPSGVAVDGSANLYIADTGNQRVRESAGGVMSTVAGNGVAYFYGDGGPATASYLDTPYDVAVDSTGSNLYIADSYNNRVRLVNAQGIISTYAGGAPYSAGYGDGGPSTAAYFEIPVALCLDPAGSLFIADGSLNVVWRADPSGTALIVAGDSTAGFAGDGGQANAAKLNAPSGVAVGPSNNVYIGDLSNNRVRKVDYNGVITTCAGNGTPYAFGDGGAATAAGFSVSGLATDVSGTVYLADPKDNQVRAVSGGSIRLLGGTGAPGFAGDGGAATAGQFYGPLGLAQQARGLLVCDYANGRTRQVSSGGLLASVAGDGSLAYVGDGGPATAAAFGLVPAVAADGNGNFYLADLSNHVVRKVNAAGVISTFAGTGQPAFSGDGGPASLAGLSACAGVAVDAAGNVYIADTGNNRVRVVDSSGTIRTLAGNGSNASSGDGGAATAASLYPYALACDSQGALYVADRLNGVVRKVANGLISTVAGDGVLGYSGDNGPATAASLFGPNALAFDAAGNLYISDSNNRVVRKVSGLLAGSATPTSTVTPWLATPSPTQTFLPSATQTSSPSPSPSLTPTPSVTPTSSPTATPSATPSPTPSPSPTATGSSTGGPSPTSTPTTNPRFSKTPSPTASPSATASPSRTPTCRATSTSSTSATPSPTHSTTATASPTLRASLTAGASPSLTATPTMVPLLTASPTDVPPTVYITSPGVGSAVAGGGSVSVQVQASDADGFIKSVSLYDNGAFVGQRTFLDPDFNFSLGQLALGSHCLVAQAVDNANLSASSPQTCFQVQAAPTSTPTPVPSNLVVTGLQAYPNPCLAGQPASVWVRAEGPVDSLRVEVYTSGYRLVRTLSGGAGAGFPGSLKLALDTTGLDYGVYYLRAMAQGAGRTSKARLVAWVWLP